MRAAILALSIVLLSASPSSTTVAQNSDPTITLVSIADNGQPANGDSYTASLSDDGRYVAFDSFATNILPGYGAGVFVRDLLTQTTEPISADDLTANGNGDGVSDGDSPSISGDARFVAFTSTAPNLVPAGVTSAMSQIYVKDRNTGMIDLISGGPSGEIGNSSSTFPFISRDGSYVSFYSQASNLVPNDTNGMGDIFVHDRKLGITERANVDSQGIEAVQETDFRSDVSDDGSLIAFSTNLSPASATGFAQHVYLRDREAATTSAAVLDEAGDPASMIGCCSSVSGDGGSVAFSASGLAEGAIDANSCYVRDLDTDTLEVISLDRTGVPSSSATGCIPALSSDGRYVAFVSESPHLVPDDVNGVLDSFVRDRVSGVTVRTNVTAEGNEGTAGVRNIFISASISGDGHVASFSTNDRLTPDDRNSKDDIYVYSFTSLEAPPEATPVGLPSMGGPPVDGDRSILPFLAVVAAIAGALVLGSARRGPRQGG